MLVDYHYGTGGLCARTFRARRMAPAEHRRRKPKRCAPRRAARTETVRYRVAMAGEVRPGQSRKFLLPIDGEEQECFVINYRGRLHAYVNRCRHVPIAMDWVDNQFFAEQGRYLMCQTHNAYYQPDTGQCIAGPQGACGKFLRRVPLEIHDGVIFALVPAKIPPAQE